MLYLYSIQINAIELNVLLGGVQVEVIKTSAKLQWTDGATNGRQITRYIVIARTYLNSTWFTIATGEY